MIFLEVANLKAWWEHLQEKQVLKKYPTTKLKEPQTYPWGKTEIHLIDPAGVLWHIAEAERSDLE